MCAASVRGHEPEAALADVFTRLSELGAGDA
jgi:hypothetical protein